LAFPLLAKTQTENTVTKQMVDNIGHVLRETGKHNKAKLTSMLLDGVPKCFFSMLGVTQAEAKRARESRLHETPAPNRLGSATLVTNMFTEDYSSNVSRVKSTEASDSIDRLFFSTSTDALSGADTTTRNLEMTMHDWQCEYEAKYPSMLRLAAEKDPHLLTENQGGTHCALTKFQASMRCAVWQAQQPDFDPRTEILDRRAKAKEAYLRELGVKQGRLPPLTANQVQIAKFAKDDMASRKTESTFDPSRYIIRAPCQKTFLNFLEKQTPVLRYTRFSSPHPCPLCDEGPLNTIVFAELMQQKVDLKKNSQPIPEQLQTQLTQLQKKVDLYKVHEKQLATSRAVVNAKLASLLVGEVVVTRDFVNHYDHAGQHVKCLHFVLQWREEAGGPLKLLKLRSYCSDADTMSCDSYYTADAMDFHFRPKSDTNPGHFDPFHKVYFVGDHGPHFASANTMFNESTSYRVYNKEVELLYFTSYHAFGRADGAGAEDKVSATQDFRRGVTRLGAASYTRMTNESNDCLSWAYELPQINRGVDVFPPASHLLGVTFLRKWCQVSFEYTGRCQSTEGIVLYRFISGEGKFTFADLRCGKSGRGDRVPLCCSCSSKAEPQALIFHEQKDCLHPENMHVMPTFVDVLPDPARLVGLQVGKKARKAASRGLSLPVTYPCKFGSACVHSVMKRRAFRSAESCNKHMQTVHKDWDPVILAASLYVVLQAAPGPSLSMPDVAAAAVNVEGQVPGVSDSDSANLIALSVESGKKKRRAPVKAKQHSSSEDESDVECEVEESEEEDQLEAAAVAAEEAEDEEDEEDEEEEEEEDSEEEESDSAPVVVDGVESFAVHSIKNKRQKKGADGLEYLVQWSGVDKHKKPYRDSWEPISGLTGSQWAIDQFEEGQPLVAVHRAGTKPSLTVNSSVSLEAARNSKYEELVAAKPNATPAELWRMNDQALTYATSLGSEGRSGRPKRSRK
jgi:hypothetical protein